MARGWLDIWNSISTRRLNYNNWPLSSPSADTADLNPTLPIFRAAVEGNLGRARRRYLRACGTSMESGAAMLGNGNVMPEPSGDAHIPAEEDFPLTSLPPLDIIH